MLATRRLAKEEREPRCFDKFEISEFEKDYRRIVSTDAFRRLQDKTQVFPLEKSDFVRTRLTHSVEASSIAKQLGVMVYKDLKNHRIENGTFQISAEQALDVSDVLMCAGLLHDVGNPPFGHFGEAVIGQWFADNLDLKFKGVSIAERLNAQQKSDLLNFEGNAQALRTLLRRDCTCNGSGSNLTCAVLATLVKYPVDSCLFDGDSDDVKLHKPGFFHSEKNVAREVFAETGMLKPDGVVARHPLTFLLEAADDIAYATGDLEDAFKKHYFSLNEFVEYFRAEREKLLKRDGCDINEKSGELLDDLSCLIRDNDGNASDLEIFQKWIEGVRRWLMYVCAYSFTANIRKIMDGAYSNDLFDDTFHSVTIKILKGAMTEFVYDDFEIAKLELAAQTILYDLLGKFVGAVLYYDDPGYTEKRSDDELEVTTACEKIDNHANKPCFTAAHKKLCNVISESCRAEYERAKTDDENNNLYLRLRMVVDYVSGMTDSYAKSLYQELCGIY